jgi:hypothetical protein
MRDSLCLFQQLCNGVIAYERGSRDGDSYQHRDRARRSVLRLSQILCPLLDRGSQFKLT